MTIDVGRGPRGASHLANSDAAAADRRQRLAGPLPAPLFICDFSAARAATRCSRTRKSPGPMRASSAPRWGALAMALGLLVGCFRRDPGPRDTADRSNRPWPGSGWLPCLPRTAPRRCATTCPPVSCGHRRCCTAARVASAPPLPHHFSSISRDYA
jgi:hypothetical protein